MVIGQIIDYASAISSNGFDSFRAAGTARGGPDLNASLAPAGLEELRLCIETATIGLCLAVDRIDSELALTLSLRCSRDPVVEATCCLAGRSLRRRQPCSGVVSCGLSRRFARPWLALGPRDRSRLAGWTRFDRSFWSPVGSSSAVESWAG